METSARDVQVEEDHRVPRETRNVEMKAFREI